MNYPEDELAARRNHRNGGGPRRTGIPSQSEYEAREVVGERVGWLLDGNYGYGAMKAAERVVKSRGNRAAQLTHMIGALEWKCPLRGASAGWNKLTAEQKRALDRAVNRAIEDYEREHGGPRNSPRNRRRGR